MTYSVFSELEYEVLVPTSFIFNLHVAKTRFQTILEESIDISPNMEMSEFSSVDKESISLQNCILNKNQILKFRIGQSLSILI